MKNTQEQITIIESDYDLKVNATAGSGKTTTLINYAKNKDSGKKFLYMVFNRSVKLEAAEKFNNEGLDNVTVETAHSLAYKFVVRPNGYILAPVEYKAYDLITRLKINELTKKPIMDTHNFIIAHHLKTLMSFYCNSSVVKVADLDYSSILDSSVRNVYLANKNIIDDLFKVYWTSMNKHKMPITHEFYLKKFQLMNPVLKYDYIMLDEGQDSSGVILDVFLKQTHAKRIIVGDDNQQIYAWRYAVNALDQVDVPTLPLSTNFRCNSTITDLAEKILCLKRYIVPNLKLQPIVGVGKSKEQKTHAVIGRTNSGLLSKAIEYVSSNRYDNIYFEGNFSNYTYSTDGGSLYDVLNIFNGKIEMVKDKMLQTFETLDQLKEYLTSVTDHQLSMFVDIVEKFENDIPKYIKQIKNRICEDKDDADVIFTTASRSKGIEYDTVELVPDFISEESILKMIENRERAIKEANIEDDLNEIIKPLPVAQLIEEINLLYVACTRAKYKVFLPDHLIPNSVTIENEHIVRLFENKEIKYESHPWTDLDIALLESTDNVLFLNKRLYRSIKSIKEKRVELGLAKSSQSNMIGKKNVTR